MPLQVLGKPASDPRGQQGILSRGKPNYMGNTNAPGAGRPAENGKGLRFNLEVLQRRLMDNAAKSRSAI